MVMCVTVMILSLPNKTDASPLWKVLPWNRVLWMYMILNQVLIESFDMMKKSLFPLDIFFLCVSLPWGKEQSISQSACWVCSGGSVEEKRTTTKQSVYSCSLRSWAVRIAFQLIPFVVSVWPVLALVCLFAIFQGWDFLDLFCFSKFRSLCARCLSQHAWNMLFCAHPWLSYLHV